MNSFLAIAQIVFCAIFLRELLVLVGVQSIAKATGEKVPFAVYAVTVFVAYLFVASFAAVLKGAF